MLKVGLTGNIGSGKTFVASIFQTLGMPVFFADNDAKKLYERDDVKTQLRLLYGDAIFSNSGELDKKALAGIVFSDEDKLQKINGLIHPLVRENFINWMNLRMNASYVIYEAAILFESGHYKNLDNVILVTAPEDVRIQRVMDRDGSSREEVMARISHQMAEEKKIPLADYIIRNDGREMVIPQVMEVHRKLLEISGHKLS